MTAMVLRWVAWQPASRSDRSRRIAAERARGRAGEGANSVDRPLARFCEHADELSEDLVVRVVQLVEVILFQVTTPESELDPDAGFLGFALCIA
jgi:hypothetical protein